MTKKMILVDTSICTGCKGCSAACKEWNDLPAEKTSLVKSYQSMVNFTPSTFTFISFDELYENGKMLWLMRKKQCFHCGDPSCMRACTSNAISKTEAGFVVIDHDKCIGCGYCTQFCPFDVPKVDKTVNKSYKCTGCVERIENDLAPACVTTCQPGALEFGDREALMAKAEKRLAELKEKYPKANIYGDEVMGGTSYVYILLEDPKKYGLPANPGTPLSLMLWKNVIKPIGVLGIGGAAAAVGVAVAINAAKGNYKKDPFEHINQEIGGK